MSNLTKSRLDDHRGSMRLSPIMWTTLMLFAIDMVTNLTDYVYHLYLGWALAPGEFATVQTINALLLILITTFAVLQPVLARYAATFNAQNGVDTSGTDHLDPGSSWQVQLREHLVRHPVTARSRTIFQRYMHQGLLLGLLLFLLSWLIRGPAAAWLNVPPSALAAASPMLILVLLRPVAYGMLQGQQQFLAFGLSRTSYAASRLLLAVIFLSMLGGGAVAAIFTLPLGGFVSLAAALLFLGRGVWRPGKEIERSLIVDGWRLSLAALIAYAAFMALQNLDLIWANRLFTPDVAGAYATAAVLRRALILLPGAIAVIIYPRIVEQVTRHRLPDRLLIKALGAIVAVTAVLTVVYFLIGPWLVDIMFGAEYAAAGPLLGWMGLAMIAFAISSVWLNLFLATRPWPFVAVLATLALLQLILLAVFNENAFNLTTVFALSGWLAALAGLLLYRAWLRPKLEAENRAYRGGQTAAHSENMDNGLV